MTHEETHGNQTIQMSPVSSLLLSVGPPGSTHEETLDFLLSLTGPAHSAHSAHSAHTGCSVLCTHNNAHSALCALYVHHTHSAHNAHSAVAVSPSPGSDL